MLKIKFVWALLMFAAFMPLRAVAASSPQRIGFQGKLLDTANNPRSGSADMIFRIFDSPSAGTELWTEIQNDVAVNNGVFTVQLGAVAALTAGLFNGASAYLEIQVDADSPMTPRQQLLMSPYAFRALFADDLAVGNTNYVQVGATLQSGAVFHVASGTVAGPLTVTGPSSFTALGSQTFSLNTSSGIRLQAGTLRVEGSGGFDVLSGVKAATLTATTAILLPQGDASSQEGAMRWKPTLNQLYIGTGTANITVADTVSSQTLTNKSLNSTGGNTVDATHLRTRLLASNAPSDGMTIKWDNAGSQWVPAYTAVTTVVPAWLGAQATFGAGVVLIDTVYLMPVIVPAKINVNQIRYRVGTSVAGSIGDVGIYDASGNLVTHGGTDSAAFTPAAAYAVGVISAPVTLQPGLYYYALSARTASPRLRGQDLAAASDGVVKGLSVCTGLGVNSGATLPADLTGCTLADGHLIFFMSINE